MLLLHFCGIIIFSDYFNVMLKKLFLFVFILTCFIATKADEGMWLPLLLQKYNEADMKAKGLKISVDDIYSVNHSSLKDAVVRFGGGCTGEMISSEGLLLTNHHCGYSSIQKHSTVDNDYLKEGFWAMSQEEELPALGLTATFLIRMEDVTAQVMEGVTDDMSEDDRNLKIYEHITEIEKNAISGTQYQAKVEAFYYGTEYFLYVTETFRDIRLVGAPPSSIGKFGGDTDNWMWPRHTGDFSLFRIYASEDNHPADYSPKNVPYQPKHHFTISLKGVKKKDFTMVFGFPGRTEEYLTSFAVHQTQNIINPVAIKARKEKLDIMHDEMSRSRELFLKYASSYASVSNYYKKWKGENRGLKKLDAITKKQKLEQRFTDWVSGRNALKNKYGHILPTLKQLYDEQNKYKKAGTLINEAAFAIPALQYAYKFEKLYNMSQYKNTNDEEIENLVRDLKEHAEKRFNNYYQPMDRRLFPVMLKIYFDELDKNLKPKVYMEFMKEYNGDYEKYTDYVFSKSIFTDKGRMMKFLDSYKKSSYKKLLKDPAYALMESILGDYRDNVAPYSYSIEPQIELLMRDYVKGLREMQPDKVFYPDANSTLRLSYGKVDGYLPRDGVEYLPFTTLEGIMDKYMPGDEEFDVPEKLRKLYETKNYGQYGNNGKLPICFIASNHTTGGNSGSPILNGEGQLIGTNFDRNWEGTMSDIMYDPEQVRNISVDIRYTLFIIDKFAGASHLVKEMTLVN